LSKTTVIIQARTGSTRLPKKVLAKIQNQYLVEHVINRVKSTKNIDQIILATTNKEEDKILLKIAKKNNIIGYAGEVNNVLKRYFKCAEKFNADPIIRITADCPLIDPIIIEKILKFFQRNTFDYVTNTLPPTFPDGLDVEIFSFDSLKKSYNKAKLKSEKEHVTPYIRNHKKLFKTFNLKHNLDLSQHRWTVDEKLDLKFVRLIYAKMKPEKFFGMKEILSIIDKNPILSNINHNIMRNEGYLKSLKLD
jgi:spore coat polysaccharide biosynthesis protein SpsF